MLTELKRGALFTVATMMLFGGGYHTLLWGVGRLAFPTQAQGSLIANDAGAIVGSSLIAQAFTSDGYFHPRPSAVDYDASSTGGSNHGPSNPDHLATVRERLRTITAADGVVPGEVPAEMITASGGGLDPDIPAAGAVLQVARIARARGADAVRIRQLIDAHTMTPMLGLLGPSRVNVLELNLALDRAYPPATSRADR